MTTKINFKGYKYNITETFTSGDEETTKIDSLANEKPIIPLKDKKYQIENDAALEIANARSKEAVTFDPGDAELQLKFETNAKRNALLDRIDELNTKPASPIRDLQLEVAQRLLGYPGRAEYEAAKAKNNQESTSNISFTTLLESINIDRPTAEKIEEIKLAVGLSQREGFVDQLVDRSVDKILKDKAEDYENSHQKELDGILVDIIKKRGEDPYFEGSNGREIDANVDDYEEAYKVIAEKLKSDTVLVDRITVQEEGRIKNNWSGVLERSGDNAPKTREDRIAKAASRVIGQNLDNYSFQQLNSEQRLSLLKNGTEKQGSDVFVQEPSSVEQGQADQENYKDLLEREKAQYENNATINSENSGIAYTDGKITELNTQKAEIKSKIQEQNEKYSNIPKNTLTNFMSHKGNDTSRGKISQTISGLESQLTGLDNQISNLKAGMRTSADKVISLRGNLNKTINPYN